MPHGDAVLVLGLGNRLLGDDATGPRVIDALLPRAAEWPGVRLCDGGTIGLSLLPDIEAADSLIVVDAARLGTPAGTVRIVEGPAMDRLAGRRTTSAHELALGDLLGAAALNGRLPERRALVAVEPSSTSLGLTPSAAVQAALGPMAEAVGALLTRWLAASAEPAPARETLHG